MSSISHYLLTVTTRNSCHQKPFDNKASCVRLHKEERDFADDDQCLFLCSGMGSQTVAGADFRYVDFRSRLPVGSIAKCSPQHCVVVGLQGSSASGLLALGRFIRPRHEVRSVDRGIAVIAAMPFLKPGVQGCGFARLSGMQHLPHFICSRSHVTRLTRPNSHSRGKVPAESGSSNSAVSCVSGRGAIGELVCLRSELANSFGGRFEVPCKVVRLSSVVALYFRGTK